MYLVQRIACQFHCQFHCRPRTIHQGSDTGEVRGWQPFVVAFVGGYMYIRQLIPHYHPLWQATISVASIASRRPFLQSTRSFIFCLDCTSTWCEGRWCQQRVSAWRAFIASLQHVLTCERGEESRAQLLSHLEYCSALGAQTGSVCMVRIEPTTQGLVGAKNACKPVFSHKWHT